MKKINLEVTEDELSELNVINASLKHWKNLIQNDEGLSFLTTECDSIIKTTNNYFENSNNDLKEKITNKAMEIMSDYLSNKDNDPLDGDEVDEIIKNLYFELNYINGNINKKKYIRNINNIEYLNIHFTHNHKMVNEWCNHCETEVKLKGIMEEQICPSCGELIRPCSLCDMDNVNCEKCPIYNK